MARYFLTGKILNSRSVLERALRDHETKIDTDEIAKVSARLRFTLDQMQGDHWTLDQVRGMEGDSAKLYFSVFDHLIVAQKEDFQFTDRNRRPPLDNVNCLLSFLYTLVAHDARSALEGVGLDAYVGFLHRDRPGRPGLALDLMEEFRSFLADRLALSLINRQQMTKKDFKKSETGAVLMTDDARKELLTAYQKRKQEEIMHPYLKETLPIGILFHVQAMLLARYLRGDIDAYPAFVWR
jgi:CRISPR-associated protein Cas1